MNARSKSTGPTPRKPVAPSEENITAREHYRREKARRSGEAPPENDLLAAARREYEALLEAEAARGKGGRPKKTARKPSDEAEEIEEGEEGEAAENIDESEDESPEE